VLLASNFKKRRLCGAAFLLDKVELCDKLQLQLFGNGDDDLKRRCQMRKTMRKAFRPSPPQLNPPPNIRLRTIERMQQLMKEALNGRELDDRYAFVLDYLVSVVSFHQAADPAIKERLFNQIRLNESEGHRVGFDQEELISLNFLVLRTKTEGQLPALEQRIKDKRLQSQ